MNKEQGAGLIHHSNYQELALRTNKEFPAGLKIGQPLTDLLHAYLGLSSEVGEIGTPIKRMVIYERGLRIETNFDDYNCTVTSEPDELVHAHLVEELGDILWYWMLMARALGVTPFEIMSKNIEKLKKRYPGEYSDDLAEMRLDKQEQGEGESK